MNVETIRATLTVSLFCGIFKDAPWLLSPPHRVTQTANQSGDTHNKVHNIMYKSFQRFPHFTSVSLPPCTSVGHYLFEFQMLAH